MSRERLRAPIVRSFLLQWRIKNDKIPLCYSSAQADGRPFFDNMQFVKRADVRSLFEVFTKE